MINVALRAYNVSLKLLWFKIVWTSLILFSLVSGYDYEWQKGEYKSNHFETFQNEIKTNFNYSPPCIFRLII